MIDLKAVSIISINTKDPENSIKAIKYSSKYINFGETVLFSNKNFQDINTVIIPKINSLAEYSLFCVKELHKYIKTNHVLIVQPDGFVTNPLMWTDDFLNFDYIGAPWPQILSYNALKACKMHVPFNETPIIMGNGGFSLRSKKILKEASELEYPNSEIVPEDNFFCVLKRKELKERGIVYADIKTAKRFALECPIDLNEKNIIYDAHFGFHGRESCTNNLRLLFERNEDVSPIKLAKKLFDSKN